MIQIEGKTVYVKGRTAGQIKTKCPNCADVGKKHLSDTPLSVNLTDGTFNCHKCGWSGWFF